MRLKLLFAILIFVPPAFAQDAYRICTKGASIKIRQSCKKGEQALSLRKLKASCVQNELLTAASGAQGVTGPRGVDGPKGEQGPAGEDGFSYGELIPPGTNAFGIISGVFDGTKSDNEMYAGFLGRLSYPLHTAKIKLGLAFDPDCPGTIENPVAAPGFLCVYPVYSVNVRLIKPSSYQNKYGFSLIAAKDSPADFGAFTGIWVYNSPKDENEEDNTYPGY